MLCLILSIYARKLGWKVHLIRFRQLTNFEKPSDNKFLKDHHGNIKSLVAQCLPKCVCMLDTKSMEKYPLSPWIWYQTCIHIHWKDPLSPWIWYRVCIHILVHTEPTGNKPSLLNYGLHRTTLRVQWIWLAATERTVAVLSVTANQIHCTLSVTGAAASMMLHHVSRCTHTELAAHSKLSAIGRPFNHLWWHRN